ncbi:MAG: AtpZ/AtpI family protein [Bacteroidia bacterium]|nr:AtpZ/AtpI family protein [Bacteroidia bacterium]
MNNRNYKSYLKQYLKYSTIGFQIVSTLAVVIGIGYWIDQVLQNKRLWATLIFSLLACVSVVVYLVYTLGGITKPPEKLHKNENENYK